ncbi:uncharacterized protein Bfra_002151 [Botrytis fragariae]|uniref:Uncharacterized protein n=1 Tax=Botrytis fragariae TaxID=1964551 RepID=A0A8H6EMQ0_9HELO|nr:uncharacterized protein Bfra_002151 [Botrytis fragariae]KAF5877784.1 hypothetical protein Bfra_002151 [Botrytis fragariae]
MTPYHVDTSLHSRQIRLQYGTSIFRSHLNEPPWKQYPKHLCSREAKRAAGGLELGSWNSYNSKCYLYTTRITTTANTSKCTNQGQPSPPQSIGYEFAPPCGCTANVCCQQHAPVSNINPVVERVKSLACWDCGPVGTIIAAGTFAIGTVGSYFTIKLAIWTATKDYIRHCQADEEAQRATVQCRKATGQALSHPPFFKRGPTNDTLVRQTLGGTLPGFTEYFALDSYDLFIYLLLGQTLYALVSSAIRYFAWKSRGHRYNSVPSARNSLPISTYSHKPEPTQGTTSTLNFARKSLAFRFTKEPMNLPWKAGNRRKLAFHADDKLMLDGIWNDTELSLRKQTQIHELVHSNIRSLLELYRLEISACTGNARRISLVDMLFISPLKDILISFPWETDTIRLIIEKLVRDKDAERFVTFCERNTSELREDTKKTILSCLDTLRFTGVDAGGKLIALTHILGSLYIAEFSRDTYSWSDILQDIEETFTVAVVTNTCLSSRPPLEGKRCANGANSSEGSLTLATRIATRIGTSNSSSKDLTLLKNNGENYHLAHGANPLEPFIGPGSKSHLKLPESFLEEGRARALTAKWTRNQRQWGCCNVPRIKM